MDYYPGRFRGTFENATGSAIWAYLTSDDALARMETATFLRKPAVEALSPILVQKFGDAVRQDRIKQMIGHMARQIMEAHHYRLDRNGVRTLSEDNIFVTASRYIHMEESK